MKIVHEDLNLVTWLTETGNEIIVQEAIYNGSRGVIASVDGKRIIGTNVKLAVTRIAEKHNKYLPSNIVCWKWAPMIPFESWVEENNYEIIIGKLNKSYFLARINDIGEGAGNTEIDAITTLASNISDNNKYPCFKMWDLL